MSKVNNAIEVPIDFICFFSERESLQAGAVATLNHITFPENTTAHLAICDDILEIPELF